MQLTSRHTLTAYYEGIHFMTPKLTLQTVPFKTDIIPNIYKTNDLLIIEPKTKTPDQKYKKPII